MWQFLAFLGEFWPGKITSRDGCFLPFLNLVLKCLEFGSPKFTEFKFWG